jgi:O-antigen/teichoic acid export membrane protein
MTDGIQVSDEETEDGATTDESETSLLEKVARDGGLAFGAGIFSKGIGFVFQVLLARFLGPSGYGLYVLGWTVTNYVQPIILLGFPDGLVRFVPEYLADDRHSAIRGVVYVAIVISLGLSLVTMVAIYTLADVIAARIFQTPTFASVLRVFALTIPFYVLMRIATATAIGFQRVKYQQAVINVFFPLLKVTTIGAVFFAGFRLTGSVYGLLLAVSLSAVIAVLLLPRVFADVSVTGSADIELFRLLRYSVPLFLVGFSELALNQTDRLILGALTASAEVGLYNAAYVLSQQTLLFFTALMTIFNPIVSELYNDGKFGELETVYESVTRWILVVSLPVVAVGIIFAPEMLTIFNEQFASGSSLLLLLFAAQLLFVSVGPARELLVMTDYQDLILIDTIAMLVANIAMNIVLVPRFGAAGAAVATIITIASVQGVQVYQAARHVGVFPFDRAYLRVLASGLPFAVLGCAAWYFPLGFVPRVALATVGAGAYWVLIWTYGITAEDVEILRNVR